MTKGGQGYRGPKSKTKDDEILDLMRQGLTNAEICRRLDLAQENLNPRLKKLREENGLVRFRRGDVVKSDRGLFEVVNSLPNFFTIQNAEGQQWIINWADAQGYKLIHEPITIDDFPEPESKIEEITYVQLPPLKAAAEPEPARPDPEPESEQEQPYIDEPSDLPGMIPDQVSPYDTMVHGIGGYLISLIEDGKPLEQKYVYFYNGLIQEEI